MNKRKIAAFMAGTILSGSLFAIDPASPAFDNSTLVPAYMLQFAKDVGFLIQGENNLSQKIVDLSQKADAHQKETTERFNSMQKETNERFDSMQKETNQRFDRLEEKIDNLISIFNITQQRNEERFAEGYINLTKTEQALTLNALVIQTNNTKRFEKLEAYWSQNFYEGVMQNAQTYFGFLLLAAGVKASSTVPATLLPFVSGVCYTGAWSSFMQVSYNLLEPTLSGSSLFNVMWMVGAPLACAVFAAHQHEAYLAPHITSGRFVVLAGVLAGVSSYWKEAYGLVQAWLK